MNVFLISECSATTNQLRHLLSQSGHECPLSNVAAYAGAQDAAASTRPKPDLILFEMSAETELAHETLRLLRERTATHILAIGPSDSNTILGAVRAGAHDYLEEDGDLRGGLSAALKRISESVQKRAGFGQVTSVISASGGSGRTLVAANLAVALAKVHGQCGLFDFDLCGSDAATVLGLKARYTIADLCRNIDRLDHKMWEQSLLVHDSSVHVLAAPETWEDMRQVTADDLQKILRFGRGVCSHVVVDLDAFGPTDVTPVLLDSAAVILLLRLDFAAVRNATRAVQHLAKIGVPSGHIQLAIGRYVKSADITPSQAEAALGMKIQHFIPDDAPLANASINCGVPIVTEAPRSTFSKAIGSIASALAHPEHTAEKETATAEEKVPTPLIGTLRTFLKMSVRECALRPS